MQQVPKPKERALYLDQLAWDTPLLLYIGMKMENL